MSDSAKSTETVAKLKPVLPSNKVKRVIVHMPTEMNIKTEETFEDLRHHELYGKEQLSIIRRKAVKMLNSISFSHITIVAVQLEPNVFSVGYACCSFMDKFERKVGLELATKRALVPQGKEYSYGSSFGIIKTDDANDFKSVRKAMVQMFDEIYTNEQTKKIGYTVVKMGSGINDSDLVSELVSNLIFDQEEARKIGICESNFLSENPKVAEKFKKSGERINTLYEYLMHQGQEKLAQLSAEQSNTDQTVEVETVESDTKKS